MCVVCGCGTPAETTSTKQDLHFGLGAARVSVPGMSQARAIQIEQSVLGANDAVAVRNRARFEGHGIAAFNLVSSPGSGKTTLLVATIEALRARHPELPVAVIEGDQQTSHDADRIRATGAPAVQVNTGKGCHLDAPMVEQAFAQLHGHFHAHGHAHHAHDHDHVHGHGHDGGILFIENVGNLVCPALWDLGEAAKVAILSVTEGEDKPLKYPDLFGAAQLMLLNKTDLLPHLTFDVARCSEMARRVNPQIEIIEVSATTGAGMDDWLHWLSHHTPALAAAHGHGHGHGHDHDHAHGHEADGTPPTLAALQQRVRELEAALARAQQP